MIIRIATIDDLPAIVAIYNQSVVAGHATADLNPLSVEERRPWFTSHAPDSYPIFVCVEDGRVLGWSSLSAYRFGREALRRTSEISYYVRSDAQRRGVGTRLVKHTIEQAQTRSIKVLFGILFETNRGSVALLKKFGFEQWAYLPDVADIEGELVSHLYYGRKL